MARPALSRPENINGDFYVDSTCIDCDTCRWMAPETFKTVGAQSAVYHQPINDQDRLRAMQALLSCPTASIGTVQKPTDIQIAQASFPIAIADNVYHCGYHAESSYGAASYFIQQPDGNMLVDSPRFSPPLVQRLEEMGGVQFLYLTHRDDVADHQKFHQHFGCDRILHNLELGPGTKDIEIQLSGSDPIEFAPNLMIIPVPGHTKGHTVLLYQQKFLFTGDHLAWSDSLGHLIAFRNACWYSWSEQIQSMQRLVNYSFEWVLPGHGRRHYASAAAMQQALQQCLAWMKTQ